jgi:AcrR family transcriptional regulator
MPARQLDLLFWVQCKMTMESLAVRWGDGRRADTDFAREQILDAAWRCYKANTVYKTSMEHIAREAKVSRTTVYRYFENRDEVLTGVLMRALHQLVDTVRGDVAATDKFGDFIVEALVCAMKAVPKSPVFSLLLQEQSTVISRVYIVSPETLAILVDFFGERFEQARRDGELREGIELLSLIDWLIHVISAYMIAPTAAQSADDWRKMLRLFLLPSIVRE